MTRWGVMWTASRYRPASLRKMLYHWIQELREIGLPHKEIRRVFGEFGENLSKSIISFWVGRFNTPYGDRLGRGGENRRGHKLRPCPELAYVIGGWSHEIYKEATYMPSPSRRLRIVISLRSSVGAL